MGNVNESLEELMKIDGAMAVAQWQFHWLTFKPKYRWAVRAMEQAVSN